jgi:hypothetical protein
MPVNPRFLAAAACLALLTGCAADARVIMPTSSWSTTTPSPQPAAPAPAPAIPVGLTIAAIGVEESTIVPLDRLPSGELAPPTDFARVGWYVGGPTPGSPGAAILAGHVDSRAGPAVFFRLKDLRPGDLVTVRRSDGQATTFTVDAVRSYPKNAFPTATVYAPIPSTALRLITCGGSFDRAARSYRDNIVVYATAY